MGNMMKDRDIETIRNMTDKEPEYIHILEEGGGEVHLVNDVYVLFEIPIYGGHPNYIDTYFKKHIPSLVDEIHSWT